MQRNRFLIALAFCLTSIIITHGQNKNGYTLTCTFEGLSDGVHAWLRTQEHDTVGHSISKNGTLVFTGVLPLDGRFHFIVFDSTFSKVNTKAIFLENKPISVSGVIGQRIIKVKGSDGHSSYDSLITLINHFNEERRVMANETLNIEDSLKIVSDSALTNKLSERRYALQEKILHQINKQNDATFKWILSHPASLYTPYALLGHVSVVEMDELKKAFSQLTEEAKKSYYGAECNRLLILKASRISEGAKIADISIIAPDGQKQQIRDIVSKSKLTLIDCWASWCKPCRAEIPELKKIYAEFKDKGFNILGVSSDKETDAWKKALIADNTPWLHGLEDQKTLSELFDLKAIPAYILVDNEGKLIAFDCAMSSIKNFGGSLRGQDLRDKLNLYLTGKPRQ